MDTAELSGLPAGVVEYLREEGIERLYPPQAEAVEAGVLDGESVVASVPTASGKTLIAELAMLASVERGGKALYIVPLRALASEKKREFERFEEFGVSVGVSTGNYESDEEWLASRDVIVATSEKVDSLVRNGAPWIEELSCVVADEIHLVDDAHRGPTLEVTLAKLRRLNPSLQTVALSATVGNAGEIADWLDAELVHSTWRPIDLRMGVHYGGALQFDDGSQEEFAIGRNENPTTALVSDALEDGGSSLVFVNSRRNAEAAARRLGGAVEPHLTGEELTELADLAGEVRDVSDSETSDDLADAIERGAAFHHAGLCVAGDTQILHSDGTFDEIATLIDDEPSEVIGLRDHVLEPTTVTDTFVMGEQPVLTVHTRTGNRLRLSENHPLPTLTENGIKWVRAGDIDPGEHVARPRRIDIDATTPTFRELIPARHRAFREYETVKRLCAGLEPKSLPDTYNDRYKWDRDIRLDDFRTLCEANEERPTTLYDRVVCDGGQHPIRIPRVVTPDICWLAGAVAGDGYLRDNGVVLTGRSDLLAEFCRISFEQFEREPIEGESPSGTPYVRLGSTLVSDVFAEHFGMSRGERNEIRLPEIPLEDELLGAYISGLFDADGSVSPRKNTNGSPCIEFYSTSDTLITQLKTALLRFGILTYRDERNVEGRVLEYEERTIHSRQNVHRLTIYGTDQLRRFEQHVGFRHSEKSSKLRKAIEQNPRGGRDQNDVIPSEIGERARELRNEQGLSMGDLEPAVSKATLSRFENGQTPMKRSTFQVLAERLNNELLREVANSDIFWDEIEAVETGDAEPLYDLSTKSSNFVANGIVAHNTSEHRTLVEDAFRDRLIKAISATPTLAAGVNTPSRRVIVRDWQRYDGDAGGMKPLATLEVHQMCGRAGRPGLDPYGEALLLANSHDELDELFERYVWADPEPVRSKLATEPALRTHVLATVASGFAGSREGLLEFLERTLYATQSTDPGRLERVTDRMLDYLERNGFLERDGDDVRATGIGHTVSRLYLDPMSAAEMIDGLRDVAERSEADASGGSDGEGRPTALGLYHLVSRTPDMWGLYLRSGDRERFTELVYERESEFLGDVPSEFETERFEDWLSALKTARLLEDWASELDEDRLTERYGIGPGDLRGKVETAQWLLNAAERLAIELDLGGSVVTRISAARQRVEHGVGEELLSLAGVGNVGRVRARRLYEAGLETREDLRNADKRVVLGALKGREKTAETILRNAGHPDPGLEDVEADESAAAAADAEAESARNEGQADLGDF